MADRRSYRKTAAWQGGRVRKAVLATTGGRCAICAWPGSDGRGRGMHLAHVVPHPYGADDESNLVPLCASCHRSFDAARAAGMDANTAARFVRARRLGLTAVGDDTPTIGKQTGGVPGLLAQPEHTRIDPICREVGEGSHCIGPGSAALPPGFAGVWGDPDESGAQL